ncbi:ATP-binding protein [Candidatus Poriferisocius sp.]|uniref:BbrUII/HgiDII family restriction enzyme n=1 Tax=Candidatus Poriferisocius sp. TaxID=3101276 RepID=UPI003B01D891
MTTDDHTYKMTVSLNILRHLGFGLYSNIAAVLSEVVANSWDADAEHVSISIDADDGSVTIEDDGHGMTIQDANNKYLYVGYERRAEEGLTPRFQRPVMGRKGIGKLSLFSIARTVEIHSVRNSLKHGFRMDSDDIERIIKDGHEVQYHPSPVNTQDVEISKGTRIVLTNMKRQLQWTGRALRRRLARRFSIIGPQHNFEIALDGELVTIEDREYQDKLQYIWTYGPRGDECRGTAKKHEDSESRSGAVNEGQDYEIDGWIGTAFEAGQLKDADTSESINKIVIMVRGKLAQEDILEEFGEGGLYTKYIIGEIHADFLDLDDQEDIATTSRQRLIEEDPRYEQLKKKLKTELKHIQSRWTELRNLKGTQDALMFPQIEEWYNSLNADQKRAAEKLLGRINQLTIDDPDDKRQLFVSGILAFESLKLRNLLHRLDEVSPENLEVLSQVFIQLDDLEASAYYQISKDRLEVIGKLNDLVDENAKEKVLQNHLHKHLWLLDPSWERATHTEFMESRIYTALDAVYDSLTKEQRNARLDLKYSTTGNKHVLIELKRANRVLSTSDLHSQISKYYSAAENCLRSAGKGHEPLEFVCVIGKRLRDWDESETGESRSRDSLRALNARIVRYDELIENALQAYRDYIDRRQEAGRVYNLIQEISEQDLEAIHPIDA